MHKNICQRAKCGKQFFAESKRQKFCSGSCGAKNRYENPPAPKVEKAVEVGNEWWRTFGKEVFGASA